MCVCSPPFSIKDGPVTSGAPRQTDVVFCECLSSPSDLLETNGVSVTPTQGVSAPFAQGEPRATQFLPFADFFRFFLLLVLKGIYRYWTYLYFFQGA